MRYGKSSEKNVETNGILRKIHYFCRNFTINYAIDWIIL